MSCLWNRSSKAAVMHSEQTNEQSDTISWVIRPAAAAWLCSITGTGMDAVGEGAVTTVGAAVGTTLGVLIEAAVVAPVAPSALFKCKFCASSCCLAWTAAAASTAVGEFSPLFPCIMICRISRGRSQIAPALICDAESYNNMYNKGDNKIETETQQ